MIHTTQYQSWFHHTIPIIITNTIYTVIIEGQNLVEFVVTLLLVKLSSSNCSFISIHSIGRLQVDLENKIVKILSNLPPTNITPSKITTYIYSTHCSFTFNTHSDHSLCDENIFLIIMYWACHTLLLLTFENKYITINSEVIIIEIW